MNVAHSRNPFKPTFGVSPPLLVGRNELIQDFSDALNDGPGAPARATLYTGARGAGKTVMLNAVQDEARSRGWLVIAETATPGLLQRLTNEHLPQLLAEQDPKATSRRLSGITAPGGLGGASWETTDLHTVVPGLRSQITDLCEILISGETGLVITVDELHRSLFDELVQLCTIVQHAFREELELVFVGAGLPAAVSSLLSEGVLTFLRRAERHDLGKVADDDVALAIERPIVSAGRTIAADALDFSVAATAGYPFLIQLVGYRIWRQHPKHTEITTDDARVGVEEARRRLGSLVHDPAFQACSDIDKTFLLVMARDDGPSKISDIAKRLEVKPDYANVYRARLIENQLIEPAGRGRLDFALPGLREYLREHAAIDHVAEPRI
ncbi:MAG: ATP-binding protein [Solirubrobacteraceae bacterium]